MIYILDIWLVGWFVGRYVLYMNIYVDVGRVVFGYIWDMGWCFHHLSVFEALKCIHIVYTIPLLKAENIENIVWLAKHFLFCFWPLGIWSICISSSKYRASSCVLFRLLTNWSSFIPFPISFEQHLHLHCLHARTTTTKTTETFSGVWFPAIVCMCVMIVNLLQLPRPLEERRIHLTIYA